MSIFERESPALKRPRPDLGRGAAVEVMGILEEAAGGPLPLRLSCWDGTSCGPESARARVVFRRPRALRRLLWAPNELGLVRAYVSGDIDIEGDVFAILDLPDVVDRVAQHDSIGLGPRGRLVAVGKAARLGALGPPPAPPAEEVRRHRGVRHGKARDATSVSHHYDVGNEFYRLVLGPTMVYSCAYWAEPPSGTYTLDHAQRDKLDLICRKLGLQPGMRMLDVGCGWGSLAIHAASRYGATVVGITVSREQAALARRRVAEAGLSDRVEIRLQDYRDVTDGPFDAIASIGMAEHVGGERMQEYAELLMSRLSPGGRLLNHAIASVRPVSPPGRHERGFIDSYVFPDGELMTLSSTLDALEHAGFEVRDVEALREHYGRTLRAWTDHLRDEWTTAIRLVGEPRARTWLLYLAACALAFERGHLTINQVVAVRQGEGGSSGMPWTRGTWPGSAGRT